MSCCPQKSYEWFNFSSTFYFTQTCGVWIIINVYSIYIYRFNVNVRSERNVRRIWPPPPRSGNLLPRHVGLMAGFSSLRPEEQKALPPAGFQCRFPMPFPCDLSKKPRFKQSLRCSSAERKYKSFEYGSTTPIGLKEHGPRCSLPLILTCQKKIERLQTVLLNITTIALVFSLLPRCSFVKLPRCSLKSGHLEVHPQGGRQRWQWFQVAPWTKHLDGHGCLSQLSNTWTYIW